MAALPLAYGIEHKPLHFLEKVKQKSSATAPPPPEAAKDAGSTSRVEADLGDFLSFSDAPIVKPLPPLPLPPSGPPAPSELSSSGAWSDSRRYAGNTGLLLLHEELVDFVDSFQPTRDERDGRRLLIKRVQSVVDSLWPGARILPFGSFDTGLYLPESDIDLVATGTPAEGFGGLGSKEAKQRKGKLLHRLAQALRSASWPIHEMEVVDKAKVPIVKFVDSATVVHVDVCLEERSGDLRARNRMTTVWCTQIRKPDWPNWASSCPSRACPLPTTSRQSARAIWSSCRGMAPTEATEPWSRASSARTFPSQRVTRLRDSQASPCCPR